MKAEYEPGRYWCRVTSQAMGKSSKGNVQFVLAFIVLGKVDPTNPGGDLLACPKNERRMFLTITEKTGEYVIDDLKRLGYTKQSFAFLSPDREGFHDFTNVEFEARCEPNEYDGKITERWRVAGDGYKPEPPAPAEVKKLDALFGKKLKETFPATVAKTKPTYEAPTADELAGASKDDIPF